MALEPILPNAVMLTPLTLSTLALNTLALNAVSLNTILAVVASALLVFVSLGVVYLSTVEWRDRRRRQTNAGTNRR